MDTELLKTFLEVSKTRHFGRAAEALYLTQSAVSFRIRQLENQLGVSLFTRHRNNIRLTVAGERLLPYADSLLSTWQLAKKDVSLSLRHQELTIGASTALWDTYLDPLLKNLYQAKPELHIEARVAPRQLLVKQIHERQLDLLITTEAPKMDELSCQQIGEIHLALFCSQQTGALERYPYIKVEWGIECSHYQDAPTIIDATPVLTTSSAHIARNLLATTQGCALLPEHWQRLYSDLVKVDVMPLAPRPLYAVWIHNRDQLTFLRPLLQSSIVNL